MWDLGSSYAHMLVRNEFELRIKKSESAGDLFLLLQILHRRLPNLRDHFGSKFQAKLDLFREAGQTCSLAEWKMAIPGLNSLGLFEENITFYQTQS